MPYTGRISLQPLLESSTDKGLGCVILHTISWYSSSPKSAVALDLAIQGFHRTASGRFFFSSVKTPDPVSTIWSGRGNKGKSEDSRQMAWEQQRGDWE